MNLVDLRDRLKAIDAALSEIQKCVSKAGSELIKANAGIGTIMGEGDGANGRIARKRRARKPKETTQKSYLGTFEKTAADAAADEPGLAAASVAMQAETTGKRRGRPRTPEAEGNSESAGEVS